MPTPHLLLILGSTLMLTALPACRACAEPDPRPGAPSVTADPASPPSADRPCYRDKPLRPMAGWLSRWQGDASLSGSARVKAAEKNKLAEVKGLFKDASVAYPPARLLFRVYKEQRVLEVWAAGKAQDPLTHVATYPVCSASGALGPKLVEGDGQVPEGFYSLDFYHARSTFYLAMRVNYPNARDRLLRRTGGAIMIHGNCVSIGCLAMTDERIQELWLMASAAKAHGPVPVHIFPSCDLASVIRKASSPALAAFWENLKKGHDQFERTHRLPRISHDRTGTYLFKP